MIQTSVLPVDFTGNERYQLHAGMFTAREVGGDFYDFFAIDVNNCENDNPGAAVAAE